MNKIKLMLTAVVVLSTVGGVLAFRATNEIPICVAALKADGTCGNGTAANPYQLCTSEILAVTTNSGANSLFRCTAPTVDDECPDNLECRVRVRTTTN